MQETKRLWKPREGDAKIEVAYVSTRARAWQLRKLLPKLTDTGTWSVCVDAGDRTIVRGWGNADSLVRSLVAYGYESHVQVGQMSNER